MKNKDLLVALSKLPMEAEVYYSPDVNHRGLEETPEATLFDFDIEFFKEIKSLRSGLSQGTVIENIIVLEIG